MGRRCSGRYISAASTCWAPALKPSRTYRFTYFRIRATAQGCRSGMESCVGVSRHPPNSSCHLGSQHVFTAWMSGIEARMVVGRHFTNTQGLYLLLLLLKAYVGKGPQPKRSSFAFQNNNTVQLRWSHYKGHLPERSPLRGEANGRAFPPRCPVGRAISQPEPWRHSP